MNNNAQIAIKNKNFWMLIGPGWNEMDSQNSHPMPKVSCPIVETTYIDQKQSEKILRRYVSDMGVSDVDQLIAQLLAIGANLIIPVDIHEFNITISAIL